MIHLRPISGVFLLGLLASSALWGGSAEYETAHKYYKTSRFEESLKVLDSIQNKDAAVFELSGLNHYMRGDYKKAVEALETAIKYDPKNSMTTLWLARAYGRRAETSSPFTAMGYARHAHQNFEHASELDPHNLEALSDLFEYYLDAPSFLGGGMDRAEAAVARIAALDAPEGEWAQAKLAEKRKQPAAVELPAAGDRTGSQTPRPASGTGSPTGAAGPLRRCRPNAGQRRESRAGQSTGALRESRDRC